MFRLDSHRAEDEFAKREIIHNNQFSGRKFDQYMRCTFLNCVSIEREASNHIFSTV